MRDSAEASRFAALRGAFQREFGCEPTRYFSAPGRTELGGNHTDHQNGCVLAAAVNLDILAAVRPSAEGKIRLVSPGFAPVAVEVSSLSPRGEEARTTAALVRGIAARLQEQGAEIGGCDICLDAQVPPGSGLSSSAALEVLLAKIFDSLFAGGDRDGLALAQIGRWAENVYFGKPCGLMDQAACALGGVVAMDFFDPEAPKVTRIDFDLTAAGYALCILDAGADHADLTGDYAAVTEEMGAVAAYFGKAVLSAVTEADFWAAIPALRAQVGDRAVLRAIHFFTDSRRAREEAAALSRGDFDTFLALVRSSGKSSAENLQNVIAGNDPRHQALALTLALAEAALGGRGACRVHGGGFGGTAQAFVPLEVLPEFSEKMEAWLGPGRCHILRLRQAGAVEVKENG